MEDYFHREYNINPKIKQMFEEVLGKKVDLSYIQVEQIVGSILKNEDKQLSLSFNDNDKKKIMSIITETNTSGLSDEVIDKIVALFSEKFTDDDFKEYVDYCINNHYIKHINEFFCGNRISVRGTIRLIEKSLLYPLRDGIIANTKYINDLIFLLDKDATEFKYDEKTLMVEDDFNTQILERFNSIKTIGSKCVFIDDMVFIIATDEEAFKMFKKSYKGLNIQKILDFKYYVKDKKKEINSVADIGGEMIGNGIMSTTNIDQVVDLIDNMYPKNGADVDVDESLNMLDEDEIEELTEDDKNYHIYYDEDGERYDREEVIEHLTEIKERNKDFDIFKYEYESEYESFSPTDSNADIDINQLKKYFDPNDSYKVKKFNEFMSTYADTKFKRVICTRCASDDIQMVNTRDVRYDLNDNDFDVQFVIENFINTDDEVFFECHDDCSDEIGSMYYKGREYYNGDYLLLDMVKDIIIEQNNGVIPTSSNTSKFDIFKLNYEHTYKSCSPTDSNSDIDTKKFNDGMNNDDYNSFMNTYKTTKNSRVICGVCASNNIIVENTNTNKQFKINDEILDVDFIIDNFINTNDEFIFYCSDCEEQEEFMGYKGREYYVEWKELLCDIVKDIIIEQNNGVIPTSSEVKIDEDYEDEECQNMCDCNEVNEIHKPVYCGKCGSTDLILINKSSEIEIGLNSDEFEVKFVKYEFLDESYESSDFKIVCNGKCDECELLVYNNKKYELSELKQMIQDIINDMEKIDTNIVNKCESSPNKLCKHTKVYCAYCGSTDLLVVNKDNKEFNLNDDLDINLIKNYFIDPKYRDDFHIHCMGKCEDYADALKYKNKKYISTQYYQLLVDIVKDMEK